jgi:hypothetical protein
MSQSGFIMRSVILTVNIQNFYAAYNQGIAVSDTDMGLLKAILLLVQDVFKVSSSPYRDIASCSDVCYEAYDTLCTSVPV